MTHPAPVKPLSFFVPGCPATAGSKTAFFNKRTGKPGAYDSCKKGPAWRSTVQLFAREAIGGQPPLDGPIRLTTTFNMPRPKQHFVSGDRAKGLRKNAPQYPVTFPDATKMLRAVEDALKGLAWHDDSQVVHQVTRKMYGVENIGALVTIETIGGGEG